MTGEVGERRRHREGQDESDDDIEKMMKDITDEIEKELEREQQEGRDCDEDPDEAMRKAIKELEEEEEERRRAYEEYMGKIQEKEEERERVRQEREESADKDSLDEFEQKELERMKKRGEGPEDALKRWREQYVREVEEYIGDTPEAKEDDVGKEDVDPSSEKPADDLSYFGDGSGQMYATKSEHKEETGGELESESKKDVPSKEHENETESTNPSETATRPPESERTRSDVEEDIDSKPRPSSEASRPGDADDLSMEKRARREVADEAKVDEEMGDEAESELPKKDSKKEFYNRPEEEWRRKHRERFEDRGEEEKEEFREVLVDQIKEKEDVEKLARRHDYESLLEDEEAMEEIEEYLQTRKALENADEDETEELAKELGVDPELLKEGDVREILPESLKELLNREGDLLWREVDRRFIESFFPESPEELQYNEIAQELEESLKEEAEAWIEIMALRREDELETVIRNGTEWYNEEEIRELSEKYDVPEEKIAKWLRFEEFPRIFEELGVRKIRVTYADYEEMRVDDSLNTSQVSMWNPEVNGAEIESISELEDIIRKNFPGIAARKDFPKLISDAAHHFELFHEFGAKENIPRGTISSLSRERGLSPTSLKRWIREGARPRIYFLIGRVPADERRKRIDRILSRLNGVTNMEELDGRLKTLFHYKSMSASRTFADNQENARKFFQFLREYTSGGALKNIAKKLGIGKSTINEWLRQSQLPTNVKVASLIPNTKPKRGNKWLPLRLDPIQNIPADFIQVPERITGPQDLLDILKQLPIMKTTEAEEYEKQFRKLPREIAFMYLLGLIVSDGGFESDTDLSARVSLYASKKYTWSLELGKAFCYAMSRIGFSAERKSDYERKRSDKIGVFRVWESEASPFLMWMKNAMLGLKASEKKKEIPIKADWILGMPCEWRIAFIQGVSDGDGSSSIREFRVSIGTVTNHDFIHRLLSSFGIHSTLQKNKVRINRYDDIVKAKELPLFKHAKSRQEGLNELSKLIGQLDRSHELIPDKEIKIVMDLHRQGYSCGQITMKLWFERGIARSRNSIEGIVRRRIRGKITKA